MFGFASPVATFETVLFPDNPNEIGAPLQGKISKVLVKVGDAVEENAPLFIIEAMKMETTITATRKTKVTQVLLEAGSVVAQEDLVVLLA